ncbi:MAG: glycosyltransferase family 39 protein [Elusimicrobia bacterium]|nr:glycosyltransferase family 39 protein [Elusimicrobiota bacterium]
MKLFFDRQRRTCLSTGGIFGWLLLVVYLTFHLITLTTIQDVYGDEPAAMQTALTLVKSDQVGSYSGRDVFSPSFQFLTNAFPYAIRPFVSHYYGSFIRLFGPSLTVARFASWLAGAAGLIFLYILALRLCGPTGGLAALFVLMADPILGSCLHICREETLLLAAQSIVGLLWIYAITKNSFWISLLAGGVAGLTPGIHTNGILLAPALCAMTLIMHESSKGWRRAVAGLGLGLVCGLTLWVISCPWDEFLLGWKIWGGYWGYGLPILSRRSFLSIIGAEAIRYIHPPSIPQSVPTPYYAGTLQVEYALVALSLGFALWRSKRQRVEAVLVTGIFTVFFGMSLLVARKYAGYSLLTLPWMALLVGRAISGDGIGTGRLGRSGMIAAGCALLFFGTKAVTDQAADPLPYVRTCGDLERFIPVGSRVLGPGQFWLGLPGRDWRDSNFLTFEKWLTHSTRHVGPALDRLRPEYVVVDGQLNSLLQHYVQRGALHEFSLLSRVEDQEIGKELFVLHVRPKKSGPPKE